MNSISIWARYIFNWWPLRHWSGSLQSEFKLLWERRLYSLLTRWGIVYCLGVMLLMLHFGAKGWGFSEKILIACVLSPVVVDFVSLLFVKLPVLRVGRLEFVYLQHQENSVAKVYLQNLSHRIFRRIQVGVWVQQEGLMPRFLNLALLEGFQGEFVELPFYSRWPGRYQVRGVQVHTLGLWGFFRKSIWIEQIQYIRVNVKPMSVENWIERSSRQKELQEHRDEAELILRRFQLGDHSRRIDSRVFARTGQLLTRDIVDESKPNVIIGVDLSPLKWYQRPWRERQLRTVQSLVIEFGVENVRIVFSHYSPNQTKEIRELESVPMGFEKHRLHQRERVEKVDFWVRIEGLMVVTRDEK